MERNVSGEVDRFKGVTTHVSGLIGSREDPFEIFLRQDGQPCLAFIDDLSNTVSKGYIELKEKDFTESPIDSKNGSLHQQYMREAAEQMNAGALTELTKIKSHLDKFAEKCARKIAFVYISILLLVWGVLIALTIIFGWDTIEPWTYFIGGLFAIGSSYVYLVVTQHEFSPIRIYRRLVESLQERTYQRFGFDLQAYEKLTEE